MASTKILTPGFSLGMRQDEPRELLAREACWNLVDFIPDNGAPLRKRGGYVYVSPDLSGVTSTAGYVQALAYAPFEAGAKLCALDEDGELYTIDSPTSATDIGMACQTLQAPFFYLDTLCIPNANGTLDPTTYDGTTISRAFATGMKGKYGCVYKNHGVVLNQQGHTNRISFTDPGTFAFTSSAWIDASGPGQGIAGLRNSLLIFTPGRTERIRGSTPPPASDMVLEPVFDQGTLDARSIVNFNDYIVFANGNGIFLTDGAVIQDLTKVAGMVSYWRSLLSGYTSTWTLAAGQYRNHYVISLMDGVTFKDAFLVNLDKRTMVRVSNLSALCFDQAVGQARPELYFGSRVGPRVGSLSSYWAPSASNKADADGTAITPLWESAFTPLQGKIRIHNLYAGYDLRDAASDNPSLALSYLTSPESGSYTALSSLAESSRYARSRMAVRVRADGFAFRVAQTGPSADTRFYALELDAFAEEQSRVA